MHNKKGVKLLKWLTHFQIPLVFGTFLMRIEYMRRKVEIWQEFGETMTETIRMFNQGGKLKAD